MAENKEQRKGSLLRTLLCVFAVLRGKDFVFVPHTHLNHTPEDHVRALQLEEVLAGTVNDKVAAIQQK